MLKVGHWVQPPPEQVPEHWGGGERESVAEMQPAPVPVPVPVPVLIPVPVPVPVLAPVPVPVPALTPVEFAYSYMTRTGRISHAEMMRRDPALAKAYEALHPEVAA